MKIRSILAILALGAGTVLTALPASASDPATS